MLLFELFICFEWGGTGSQPVSAKLRNIFEKAFRWSVKIQFFSRPCIEFRSNLLYFSARNGPDVSFFGYGDHCSFLISSLMRHTSVLSSPLLPGVRFCLLSDSSCALHHTDLPPAVESRFNSRFTVDLATPME